MKEKYRLLIIDDEIEILQMLKLQFESDGYDVYLAKNSDEALKQLSHQIDLILLDINMPQINGLEFCQMIRRYIACPIIFLTARVDKQDIINGLMSGGDDYITKPFNLEELNARVMAHLRRENRSQGTTVGKFEYDLIIDYGRQKVFYQNQEIKFSNKEFAIIKILSMNPSQVYTRELLYQQIWGYDSDGDSKVIKEHVRKIRAKFMQYSLQEYIETVWGVGYRWKK
ncbi:response regulator transcription factor [uncultured Thomasclavelia sp.]|uniref:response regulator transcription factor n=1 Tax=uncultured Thomasclavelia sp. TaxID=3025759 RepID=UPI0025F1D43E|nr:response regulator transcription factor [uncultured Thomasclavelia sp.]